VCTLLITESRQCYRSGSIKSLCEILMSWGDFWMTVGQASSKTVIDQTIDQWRLRLRTQVKDSGRQLKHLIICFNIIAQRCWSIHFHIPSRQWQAVCQGCRHYRPTKVLAKIAYSKNLGLRKMLRPNLTSRRSLGLSEMLRPNLGLSISLSKMLRPKLGLRPKFSRTRHSSARNFQC